MDEIKRLLLAIKSDDDRMSGKRRFVMIEGEGGIGKTRVLEEIMDIAEDENFK